MKNGYNKTGLLPLSVAIMVLAGCAGTGNEQQLLTQNELVEREKDIENRERLLSKKEVEVKQAALAQQQSTPLNIAEQSLLPPKAKVGECYARVWVDPKYKQEEIKVKVREESERIQLTEAKYRWGQKEVLVSEASSRLEVIPAVYGLETESLLVREERNIWKTGLANDAAPASDKLLATAKAGGINLESATPGMCFHEHFKPAEYRTVKENVLVSQASKEIVTEPAQYKWIEETVMVSEASTRIENIPAVFETQKETILDVPAHTIWKKGTGPIQRIDASTGEIMCLVDVPATYKTVAKKVLKSPATTRTIDIPAKYKTVKVRKMVAAPTQVAQDIPEQFSSVSRQELLSDAEFVWHEVHDMSLSAKTRTGAKICLTQVPAKYEKVTRKVVKTPASTRTIEIPAKYETVKVKELVSAASEEHIAIPAVFKTVTQKKLVADGFMEWRSILCETNMTRGRISQIQQALADAGYNPGPIDGDIGRQTMVAVNKFQQDKSLPVDKYLNIETLKALGVSPK